MFGWLSRAAARISRRKRSSAPGRSSRCLPTTLSTSGAVHELVPGQVDDAHAAAAQLADDLVLRVIGQLRQDFRRDVRSGRGPGLQSLGVAGTSGFRQG